MTDYHATISTRSLDTCASRETTLTIANKDQPLNDAVERALTRWPAGMTLGALDPHVRWATGRSLSQWARALDQRTRADLLRALPAVGVVDNIAGHTVVYPAGSRDYLHGASRSKARPGTTAHDLCEPEFLKALAARATPVVVVDTVDACREAVNHIRRCGEAAFDCEGTSVVRPGTASPGVALIQMAPHGGPSYLFDMCRPEPGRSARALMHYGGLGALLADRSVTKVVHDAREDARAVATAYNCHLAGVFDTQAVHMRLAGGDILCPGLNAVLAEYGFATNQHKDAMRAIYPRDLYPWHRRPLLEWMIEYALSDIALLLQLKDALVARLLAAAPAPPWAVGLLPLPSPPVRSTRCWAVVATRSPDTKVCREAPQPSTPSALGAPSHTVTGTAAGSRSIGTGTTSGRVPLTRAATIRVDPKAGAFARQRRSPRKMSTAKASLAAISH
nr:DnaQ like exonuclease [Pandoravirus aubagnensis]